MNRRQSFGRYLFFHSYRRLIVKEKTYAHFFMRLVLAADKLFGFKFLREYARRQHDAFGLDDEKHIVALVGSTVVDIGSGIGYWGLHLKSAGRETVAIELNRPYAHFTKRLGAYAAVIIASAGALPIKSNCFDTALALEIIEHVNKQDGMLLIREAKRVSNCVILSTPQYPSSNLDLPGWVPETEHHLSCWTVQDFSTEGFETRPLGKSILAVHDKKDM